MFESTIAAVPVVTGATLNAVSDYNFTEEFRDRIATCHFKMIKKIENER